MKPFHSTMLPSIITILFMQSINLVLGTSNDYQSKSFRNISFFEFETNKNDKNSSIESPLVVEENKEKHVTSKYAEDKLPSIEEHELLSTPDYTTESENITNHHEQFNDSNEEKPESEPEPQPRLDHSKSHSNSNEHYHDDKTEETPEESESFVNEIYDRCSAKLYSCRGRCNSAPRLACSCHVTCAIYGNCCEDFKDSCPTQVIEQKRKYGSFLPTHVKCVGNNFLISTCLNNSTTTNNSNFENVFPGVLASNITVNGLDKKPEHIFTNLDTDDIMSRCHQETISDQPLQHAPVTDTETRLHFKNIFCAVCSGVFDIEFWDGLAHCKNGKASNNTTQPSLMIPSEKNPITTGSTRTVLADVKIEEILASDKCDMFWRPTNGDTINPCLQDAESAQHEHSSGLSIRTHTYDMATEIEQTVIDKQLSEKFSNLHLEWRNVSGEFNGTFNQSYFQEKCQTLNSFVENPLDPTSKYKNKYCFMLDRSSTSTHKFCEPSLAITDDGGEWYTLSMDMQSLHDGNDAEDDMVTTSKGLRLDSDAWVVYEGIEELFWDDLVSDSSLSRCDGKTSLLLEGKCRKKAFYLTMKTNFTFIRSSLIRGDFNAQVEKFTDILVDTFVDNVSNRTECVVVSFEHSKVSGSSVRYQSSAEFQCLDIFDSDIGPNGLNTVTPVSLVDGGSIGDDDVNHYIMFVTDTLKIVVEKEKAVTLPVTIELAPCIFPDRDSDDRVRGFCTKLKNAWRAARRVKTIIGGLSLEGILTIICCILSVFGLIIRLALQNVVPFYKSYPGKIQFGLCLSLFLAYALFMLGGLVNEGSRTCMVLAVFTHVAFLSALFWMNVTAFEIWRTFRTWRNQVVSRGHASLILSVFYAVGIPLLVVMTALLVEEFLPHSVFSPSYGEHDCWLNGSMAVAFYFVTPCCIICCVNAIFVGLTLRSLRRQRTSISEFKKSNATTAVTDVGIVIKIILLVGITWLLGLLAALVDNEWLWILFTVINASLGFLISVVLVFNKRVYYTVRAKCLCYTSEAISVVSTQVQRH